MTRSLLRSVLLLAAAALCAPAAATLTNVNPLGAGSGSERCLAGVACPGGGAYSGALSLIGSFAADLNLGPLTRIDDDLDTTWLATGPEVWVRARARYAADVLNLGLDAGSGFHPLTGTLPDHTVRVSDRDEFSADPQASDFAALGVGRAWHRRKLDPGTDFAFVLRNLSEGYRISSDPSRPGYANSGKSFLDYMVTWQVNDTVPHFFIAWEDRDPRHNSTTDHDYNDLVLEVLYAQPLLLTPVPEPGTFALLLLGLGVLAFARRRGGQGSC